jgi:hypothetical protein
MICRYPARDARFDGKLGAKRIEWSFKDNLGQPWQATTNVKDQAIACKLSKFIQDNARS